VVKRITATEVETASGNVYKLVDSINVEKAKQAGFTDGLIKAFSDGFPRNWKKVLENHLNY